MKGREHSSSSVPVRYIPKSSSEVNELEKSLPANGSEKWLFDKSWDGYGRTSVSNEEAQNGNQMYKKGFSLGDPQQGNCPSKGLLMFWYVHCCYLNFEL